MRMAYKNWKAEKEVQETIHEVKFPKSLFDKLNDYAEVEKITRPEVIRTILAMYFDGVEKGSFPGKIGLGYKYPEKLIGELIDYCNSRGVAVHDFMVGIIAKFMAEAKYSGKDSLDKVVSFGKLYAEVGDTERRMLSMVIPKPEDDYMNSTQ